MAKKLIELHDVVKEFDGEIVVNHMNLYINENEFVTFVGPSGCGKTTTLRMIGGFEQPTSGTIILDGVSVNDIPAHKRPINTVFQRYALFPHLNVFGNVAFGLKNKSVKDLRLFFGEEEYASARSIYFEKKLANKKISDEEKKHKLEDLFSKKDSYFTEKRILHVLIEKNVKEALRRVKLEGFETRSIEQMSGGQMQRVAIARAIINKPKVLLLDEPLAALDLKLRENMQYELKEMQKALGITFVFVTHDQEEALTMSDRVVVMNHGVIQQVGTPEDIYNEPKNSFVANFVGESNIMNGIYTSFRHVTFFGHDFECVDENFAIGEKCQVVIRPEDWDVVDVKEASLVGVVDDSVFKGVHFELCVIVQGKEVVVHTYENIPVGHPVGLSVDPYEIHLMKKEDVSADSVLQEIMEASDGKVE
jgi:spermidine/putrescine transport system ATP-binding protein